jgi:DNA replication protein DnaD
LIIKALSIGATKAHGNAGSKCKYAIKVLQSWAADGIKTVDEWNKKFAPKSRGRPSKAEESKEKNKARARKKPPPKTKYAEFVSLTNVEHETLVAKLGEDGARRCIEILDNYKGSTGKRYKSDYRTILNWVVQRYEEEQQKQKSKPSGNIFMEEDV